MRQCGVFVGKGVLTIGEAGIFGDCSNLFIELNFRELGSHFGYTPAPLVILGASYRLKQYLPASAKAAVSELP